MTYTYTIFDGNPNSSGNCKWSTHEDLELEAENDENAQLQVSEVLEREAASLSTADGYSVGDRLYALIEDESGVIVSTPSYELTAEDLA